MLLKKTYFYKNLSQFNYSRNITFDAKLNNQMKTLKSRNSIIRGI